MRFAEIVLPLQKTRLIHAADREANIIEHTQRAHTPALRATQFFKDLVA